MPFADLVGNKINYLWKQTVIGVNRNHPSKVRGSFKFGFEMECKVFVVILV